MNPNAIPTPSVEARPNGYVTRMSGGVRSRGVRFLPILISSYNQGQFHEY